MMTLEDLQQRHKVALLGESILFRRLSDHDLAIIAAHAQNLVVEPGAMLTERGEHAESLYLIHEGIVRIDYLNGDLPMELAMVSSGDLLGWSSLVDPFKYTNTAVAATRCELVRIPAAPVLRFCDARPEVGYQLMSAIAVVARERYSSVLQHLAGLQPHSPLTP